MKALPQVKCKILAENKLFSYPEGFLMLYYYLEEYINSFTIYRASQKCNPSLFPIFSSKQLR